MTRDAKQEFQMTFDWHTHTTFSHGKGSIEDNVKAGIAAGLLSIGISDHGPGHLTFGVCRKDIPIMRQEVDRLQPLYPEIKILLGIEANIINMSGRIDVSEREAELYDYIMAGYHFGVAGENPLFASMVHARNFLSGLSHKLPPMAKLRNTELVVRAIYENEIRVLTHPGSKGDIFIEEVARACAARNTLLEINNSGHGCLSVEGIREAAGTNVKFVISSDAHHPSRVGHFGSALKRIQEAGLDYERVVNLAIKNA